MDQVPGTWRTTLHDIRSCNPENMTFFLMKAPEHTWGTPGISGWGAGGDYNTTAFRKDIGNQSFMKAAASWAEQRLFNELAARALEEGPAVTSPHPLASEVRQALRTVEQVDVPSTEGMQSIPLSSTVTFKSGTEIQLSPEGAIFKLQLPCCGSWATQDQPLAAYVYQTFNDSEWKPFTYAYLNDHQMQTGFCKPGSNNFTESALWRPSLQELFVAGSAEEADSVIARMQMPQKAHEAYGAPSEIYLQITATRDAVDLSLITVGKLPTMVAESSSVTFLPAPKLTPFSGSAWRLKKLGQDEIDPEGVLDGGNQFTHGVWGGVKVQTAQGQMTLDSLDAINVNPMTPDFPVGNPLPASYKAEAAKAGKGLSQLQPGSVQGMAVNLHNNLWNTNYALYYPYYDALFCASPLACQNSNSLYRFHLEFQPAEIYV
ncbi:unnamed protein product [Effrenium voratum]|nr:unnamed protein product [Effrenium voratum]